MILKHWRWWVSFLAVALPFLLLVFGDLFGLQAWSNGLGMAAGVLASVYLAWRSLVKRANLPASGLEGVLLAGLLAAGLSLAFSTDPRLGLEQLLGSVGYMMIFYVLVDCFEVGANRTGAIYAVLLVTGLVAVLAVLETYVWYSAWWQQVGSIFEMPPYPYRLVSVLGHPNFYMAFVNLLAPLALVFFFRTGRRSMRVLSGLWLAFYAISAPFSSSRGGWLGAAAWVGVLGLYWVLEGARWKRWLVWLRRFKVWGFAGLSVLLAGSLLVLYRLYLAFAAHPSHGSNPFAGRNELWGVAVRIWQLFPWTGAGVGRYLYEYLGVSTDFPPGFWAFHAHNLYLTVLAEQGLIGFAAFMALIAGGVIMMFRWQRSSPTSLQPWTAGMLAGMVSFLIHSIFDDFTTTVPVMVTVALIGSFLRAGVAPPSPRLRHVPLGLLLLLVVPLTGLTTWITWASRPMNQGLQHVSTREAAAGSWREVAELISESAARDPAYVYYQFEAGMAWAKVWGEGGNAADLVMARADLARAVHLEPTYSLAWANLAVLDWQAGDRDLAIERMHQAVTRSPKESSYPINLGWFYEQQGDAANAATWYGKGLELSPGLATHTFWQAVPTRQRVAQAARKAFEQSLEESPPFWKIGLDALASGSLEEARRALALAEAAGEDEKAILGVQAALAEAEGRSTEARQAYENLLAVTSGDFLLNSSYIADMYARFHKRRGLDVEIVPGYLKLMTEYGQTEALERFYYQQVELGDCVATEKIWLALQRSAAAGEALTKAYPGCGAPLP